jgi:hypothetical protein
MLGFSMAGGTPALPLQRLSSLEGWNTSAGYFLSLSMVLVPCGDFLLLMSSLICDGSASLPFLVPVLGYLPPLT